MSIAESAAPRGPARAGTHEMRPQATVPKMVSVKAVFGQIGTLEALCNHVHWDGLHNSAADNSEKAYRRFK